MSSRIFETINERAPLIGGVIAVIQDRQIPFLAAGLAFYAVLAIFPAVAATIAVFGLVASPTDAERLVTDVLSIAPGDASSLLTSQLSSLTEASGTGLGVSAVISTVLLLWSASAGMQAMIASGSSRLTQAAATPMQGAVSRLQGSPMMDVGGNCGN